MIAGCGGGGASAPPAVSHTPASVATPSPAPQGPPPTAAPSNAPIAGTAQLSGIVADHDRNDGALAGAIVSIGTSFAGGVLGGIAATVITGAGGGYAFASVPPQAIFMEVDAPGYISSHRFIALTATAIVAKPVLMTRASADESAALTQINADRARLGTGNGSTALTLDADAEITARFRAAEMAAGGWYSHIEPGTNTAANDLEWCAIGGFCGNVFVENENIDANLPGTTLETAEAAYIAEGPSGGHDQTIVSPLDVWAGFGEALNGAPFEPGFATLNYFATEITQKR